MSASPMGREPRSVRFRREREARWKNLESMVNRALQRGPGVLRREELHLLPQLYREALASLSVARATAMDRALVAYLESLGARAWLAVYGTREPSRRTLVGFLARGFPRAVREIRLELILATAVFFLATTVAFVLVGGDPEWFSAFVDPGLSQGRNPWATEAFLRGTLYDTHGELADFAASLFTHNTGVGLLCFGLGVAAGLPTLYLLFANGLVMGAFLALFDDKGLLPEFLGWLLPHGVPEIAAILLCAAAGLRLGRALVLPGRETRGRALGHAGRRASMVMAGTVLLFFGAGFLEGVVRQTVFLDWQRYLIAGTMAVVLAAWYVLGSGRGAWNPGGGR